MFKKTSLREVFLCRQVAAGRGVDAMMVGLAIHLYIYNLCLVRMS